MGLTLRRWRDSGKLAGRGRDIASTAAASLAVAALCVALARNADRWLGPDFARRFDCTNVPPTAYGPLLWPLRYLAAATCSPVSEVLWTAPGIAALLAACRWHAAPAPRRALCLLAVIVASAASAGVVQLDEPLVAAVLIEAVRRGGLPWWSAPLVKGTLLPFVTGHRMMAAAATAAVIAGLHAYHTATLYSLRIVEGDPSSFAPLWPIDADFPALSLMVLRAAGFVVWSLAGWAICRRWGFTAATVLAVSLLRLAAEPVIAWQFATVPLGIAAAFAAGVRPFPAPRSDTLRGIEQGRVADPGLSTVAAKRSGR